MTALAARTESYLKNSLLILGGSLFLALSAQIAIPLPGIAPFTLQTMAAMLVGMMLGPKNGALAVCAYLVEGASGLPFFAQASAGPAVLLGPTGGYLVGFIGAAYFAGFANRSIVWLIPSLGVIYLCGLSWLMLWVGPKQVLTLGFYPFILADLFKLAAVASFAKWRR